MGAPLVVFAGGRTPPNIEGAPPWKALLPLAGKTLLEHVLEGLRGFPVEGIWVVAPDEVARILPPGVQRLESREKLWENVELVLQTFSQSEGAWLVGADTPLLRAEMLAPLREKSAEGWDVVYPIVPRNAVERRFPGARRTYARLREGQFTGGNVLFVRPARLVPLLPRLREVLALRKKPLALARKLGIGFLVRALLGRLRIAEAEERVRALTGLRGCAVQVEHPEIAMDVDCAADYFFLRDLLAR